MTGGEPAAAQWLRPGDSLAGMPLTTGSNSAISLWAVCPQAAGPGAASDCRVPVAPLAVGPTAAVLPDLLNQAEWGLVQWSLVLDGQPVDLAAFGTYDSVQPRKAHHGRDALFIYRAWDVVIAEPTPGPHTLQATVTRLTHSGKEIGTLRETAEWVLQFLVE